MRSIERRYKKFSRKNRLAGGYINLMRAVRGMKFKRRTITKFFDDVISAEDCVNNKKSELLDNLCRASMEYVPRTAKNKPKIA